MQDGFDDAARGRRRARRSGDGDGSAGKRIRRREGLIFGASSAQSKSAADRLVEARAARAAATARADAWTEPPAAASRAPRGLGGLSFLAAGLLSVTAAGAAALSLLGVSAVLSGGDDSLSAGGVGGAREQVVITFGPGGDVAPPPPVVFGVAVDPTDLASRLVSDRAFADASADAGAAGAALSAPTAAETPPAAAETTARRDPIALLSTEDGASARVEMRPPDLRQGLSPELAAALNVSFPVFEDRMARENARTELECLAQAIYFEARGEPLLARVAVVEVILTRVEARYWPNTICGVVNQGAGTNTRGRCQFSYTCDGRAEIIRDQRSWRQALDLAEFMMRGAPRRLTGYATHYHAHYVNPPWARQLERTGVQGVHIFFRRVMRVARSPMN